VEAQTPRFKIQTKTQITIPIINMRASLEL